MRAAKYWGLHPRLWRAENVDDRATMLAMFLFENTLEARRAEHRNELLDRSAGKDREGNEYRKLKERLRGTVDS